MVSLDIVAVRVPYPGATPVEVEEGILLRIEEAIADLEGIDTLDSLASEGLGLVTVKVRTDHDTRRLLDDVKTRVDAITTFPKEAEEPTVEELVLEMRVITVALSSEAADALTLRKLAEEMREDFKSVYNELEEYRQKYHKQIEINNTQSAQLTKLNLELFYRNERLDNP